MYIEKNMQEALTDYLEGCPVTILREKTGGSMEAVELSQLLNQGSGRFLVDLPKRELQPDEIIQAVHETQGGARKLHETTEHPGNNSDRHLCKTCKYRGKKKSVGRPKKSGPSAGPGCDYYLITDKERGCDVEECDKWEEG